MQRGDEILKLQEIPPEDARQNQKFPLIYLAQLSRYRNGLNAFEKQYMGCNILADLAITHSREDVHQMFLTKVVKTTPSNSDGYAMKKWEEISTEFRETLKHDQTKREERIKKLEDLNNGLQRATKTVTKPNERPTTSTKKKRFVRNGMQSIKTRKSQAAKSDTTRYRTISKVILKSAEEIIIESQKKVTDLENEVHGLKVTVEKKEHAIKALTEEKDDYLTRLSSITGDTGNQAIPALCDPNHPMKIAERFGVLYDNEWTDVIDRTDEVKALYPDMKTAEIEVVIIRHLYQLLMCCYRECLALSKEQLMNVRKMILDDHELKLNTKGHGKNIPGCKEVYNIRRQGAAEYADYLFQHKVIVDKIVLSDWEYLHKSNELVGLLTQTAFFEKCIHLCWHMAIQDPVMHLDEELTQDTVYDKSVLHGIC